MHDTQARAARRTALARGIGLAGACLLIAIDARKGAAAKTPKAALLYQEHPHNGQRCGDCKYFSPDANNAPVGTCSLVEGTIDRDGWCMAYAAKS
jgi:hypothetical protein